MSVFSARVKHLWLEVDASEVLSRSTRRSPTNRSSVDKRTTGTLSANACASLQGLCIHPPCEAPKSVRYPKPNSATQHKTPARFAYPEFSFLTPMHSAYTSNSSTPRSEASTTMYRHLHHITRICHVFHTPEKQDSQFSFAAPSHSAGRSTLNGISFCTASMALIPAR
jgi:hypothetical protein